MANTILLKRSSTALAIPTAGQLSLGELAVNVEDGKLYMKKTNGSVIQLGGGANIATLEMVEAEFNGTDYDLVTPDVSVDLTASNGDFLEANYL